jgi:hypothetical protein
VHLHVPILQLSLLLLQFLCCIGWALVWISYQTVRGALLCSCWLFAPHYSAINSLQECSSLFEEPKGSATFAGYVAGRRLCMHPYFDCCLYFFNLLAVLAGYLCEFHTKQWVEPCSVPIGCLPHTFVQSMVCRSAADSLKSWRVALLLQDRWREGALTFSLLPSEIAFILSIIYNNLVTMKDYFSMSKSNITQWLLAITLAISMIGIFNVARLPIMKPIRRAGKNRQGV